MNFSYLRDLIFQKKIWHGKEKAISEYRKLTISSLSKACALYLKKYKRKKP